MIETPIIDTETKGAILLTIKKYRCTLGRDTWLDEALVKKLRELLFDFDSLWEGHLVWPPCNWLGSWDKLNCMIDLAVGWELSKFLGKDIVEF